jgi:hypothetical protein
MQVITKKMDDLTISRQLAVSSRQSQSFRGGANTPYILVANL